MNLYHHTTIGVSRFDEAVEFYTKTLTILNPNLAIVKKQFPDHRTRFANFIDRSSGTSFILNDIMYRRGTWTHPLTGSPEGHHLCFHASSRESIDLWYKTALQLGATRMDIGGVSGAPAYIPLYGDYYGATILDPHGYRLEACIKDYLQTLSPQST